MNYHLNQLEETTLKTFMGEVQSGVNQCLEAWLPKVGVEETSALNACMRYSVFAGGKRLRPALVLAAYRAAGGLDNDMAFWVGAAFEMLHTYSLMQDDLPCMDNDDLRRGKPSAHKQFNEATALLASDGLQTGAFELLADPRVHPHESVRLELITLLSQAVGGAGMVAGQMIDMAWEWHKPVQMDTMKLMRLGDLKTGRLITACCLAGAILARAPKGLKLTLASYSEAVGRSFQIYDDVLDAIGNSATLGKTAGKDAKMGKSTFVAMLGTNGAKDLADMQVQKAIWVLQGMGPNADPLRLLARYCVTRKN